MLALDRISKSFGKIVALDDVSLQVKEGETLVLLGTSGCGKSTILKIILGLFEADSGHVTFKGQIVTPDLYPLIRSKTGYVIQTGGLFPHLTARRNVAIMADYLQWPKTKIAERVEELAALVQIEVALLSKYPRQLSGGQCQRVGLMRALMLDPDILVLDEPLGALDPITRKDLQIELKEIFDRLRKTVIMVTHDLPEASYFGDQVALMNQGKVVQRGVMQDFFDRPADEFVTRFVNAQR